MDVMLARIRKQAAEQTIRVTQHAQKEMDEEDITLDEVLAAIASSQVLEETAMKCNIEGCPGEYEQREVVHTVRQGNRIIVIEHVPAEVCPICGDVLFTPETVRTIERLRHTALAPIRSVPLYDFKQAKSA